MMDVSDARGAKQQYRLTPMSIRHVDALLSFEREMFGTEAWTRQGYLDELADTELRYYVVAEYDDGTLLGWAGVMIIGETAQVLTVGTVPDARRRGIGRTLLQALVDEAVRRRADELLLEVRADNDAAIALYESEGFAPLGVRRGYYAGGAVDAVTMRRPLP